MAKINNPPPRAPLWPWGGPRVVRERLVDPAQFDRKKRIGKKGDPKNPALASAALLDSIGPAHSSEELRLPLPPAPTGHDADLESFLDRPHLRTVAERADPDSLRALDRKLASITASPDRLDRMKALLAREREMLVLVKQMDEELRTIISRMWEAQKDEQL